MKIIECDNRKYIRLGDLDHLIRVLRRSIFDKYDRNDKGEFVQEDGTKGITHDDGVVIGTLSLVMGKVMENLVHACETPEEIRELHKRIETEFYCDKYVVTTTRKDEDGSKELIFFERYCTERIEKKLRADGKTEEEIEDALLEDCGDPVFCNRPIDANYFEDHEFADSTATFLRKRFKIKANVEPAWYFDPNAKERLEKWLSENEEEDQKNEAK